MIRNLFLAAVLSVAAISVNAAALTMEQVNSLKPKEVEKSLTESHPSMYIAYSIRQFKSGKQDDAVLWYYIGQIRWKYLLLVNPDPASESQFAAVTKDFGQVIGDWAGESTQAWANTIERALAWDGANPNSVPTKDHPAELEQARKLVEDMRTYVVRNEAAIAADRQTRGINR
jgi:hypothetical protein